LLSTACEDAAGLAAAYQLATVAVEPLQQQVSLVAGAKISRSLQQLRELYRQGLDFEAALEQLERQLLAAAGQQQQQHPASTKRHAVALAAQLQQEQPAGGKRRRVVHLPAVLLCAGDAGADADVTFATAAAKTDSYVEARTGELRSKCLDGDGGGGDSWCCLVLACMVCANRLV
jgi:hypothetical protein